MAIVGNHLEQVTDAVIPLSTKEQIAKIDATEKRWRELVAQQPKVAMTPEAEVKEELEKDKTRRGFQLARRMAREGKFLEGTTIYWQNPDLDLDPLILEQRKELAAIDAGWIKLSRPLEQVAGRQEVLIDGPVAGLLSRKDIEKGFRLAVSFTPGKKMRVQKFVVENSKDGSTNRYGSELEVEILDNVDLWSTVTSCMASGNNYFSGFALIGEEAVQ